MRIGNKVGCKEGRVDKGQTVYICELCSYSVNMKPDLELIALTLLSNEHIHKAVKGYTW